MKKLTAISLILILVLALCACTNTTQVEGTDTSFDETLQETAHTVTPDDSITSNLELIKDVDQPETIEDEPEDWTLSWSGELTGPNDFSKDFEEYDYSIVYYDENRCILMAHYQRSLWLADAYTGDLICLSGDQKVIDYTVAYDTIYWYNLDREVWASNWQSLDCTAKLFCEDAIAVSPFTDECEGAIVAPERANIDYGYGDLPIYSPYGIVD